MPSHFTFASYFAFIWEANLAVLDTWWWRCQVQRCCFWIGVQDRCMYSHTFHFRHLQEFIADFAMEKYRKPMVLVNLGDPLQYRFLLLFVAPLHVAGGSEPFTTGCTAVVQVKIFGRSTTFLGETLRPFSNVIRITLIEPYWTKHTKSHNHVAKVSWFVVRCLWQLIRRDERW